MCSFIHRHLKYINVESSVILFKYNFLGSSESAHLLRLNKIGRCFTDFVFTVTSIVLLVWHGENCTLNKDIVFTLVVGRAIAQAVSRWLPTAAARGSSPGLVMWDLWWTKWRWGRFSSNTSVSPANLHCTNCSTIILIYHLGFVQ
jgi:hypothetical protein